MIIGLTGGIASGKTTVSSFLKAKNFLVLDADKIAKEISEQEAIKREIVISFGEKILDSNSNIDRKKLKKIIFEDKKELAKLNSIIHPEVYKFFEKTAKEKRLENSEKIIIFDVPLLFESGIDKLCDKILLIWTNRERRIKRIMERDNIESSLAEKIIDSQMSDKEKIKKADIIIENNGSIDELYKKIERFCENL